ncbi:hypothetical protein [Ferrovibrio sp.]|uniref:hypothetical protein n=1 Tax=Ferrovibrio sp. TaxID=1917215 RepID=UPI003513163B
MAEKKEKMKLTFRQWAICYAGSLGFGGLAWWATGDAWIGGGVLIGFTAVYVFYIAGKFTSGRPAAESDAGLSRQQKRAAKRKIK